MVIFRGIIRFYEKRNKALYPGKPSFRTFYIKAAAFALKLNPGINIKILNNEVIPKSSVDVTIAFHYLKVTIARVNLYI